MNGIHRVLSRIDRAVLRLAVSYIAVVMAVSLTFSVFFYVTSARALHVSGSTYLMTPDGPSKVVRQPPKLPSPRETLNVEAATIKRDLLVRLSLLNVVVLVVGSGVCLYLAYKTLRPIKLSMELQERFISDASHELKTPIAGLRLRGEVALRDQKLSLSEAKKTIEENVRQAIVLERLSAGLLELARESSLRTTTMTKMSLDDIAESAVEQCRDIAQAKSISIDTDLAAATAMGLQEELVRVCVILLDNAIKFSTEGSTVYVESFLDKDDAVVVVRDEGRGIREAHIPHIFERFYQADGSRANQGSGLGLSIAEGIVKLHNGDITVQSKFGKGSVFSVRVPSRG